MKNLYPLPNPIYKNQIKMYLRLKVRAKTELFLIANVGENVTLIRQRFLKHDTKSQSLKIKKK